MVTKTRYLYYIFYDVHIKPIQTPPSRLGKNCVFYSLMFTVHTPTIQHTRFPPIIHNMLSIIIHTSTHHSIKTHKNSQTSSDKHIFITPWLIEVNPNVKHFPLNHGGSQDGGNVMLSRSQDVLPCSRSKTPPKVEFFTRPDKNACSPTIRTQFDTLPSDLLCNINKWHFTLVHLKKIKKFLTRLTHKNPALHSTRYYKLKYLPSD